MSPLPPNSPPPNWPPGPPQPGGPPGSGNPFSDQPPSPFGPGGPHPQYYPYPPPRPLEDDPAMRWVLPVGTSGWAIAAGYLGLFSLLCLPGPLALICGLMAVRDLRRNPHLSGWGRATLGLVLGSFGTLVLLVWLCAVVAEVLRQ